MAEYIDTYGDFFYPKSHSGLESVMHLQVMRRLIRQAATELRYVFPRDLKDSEVLSELDSHTSSLLNILNNVLSKKKTKK